MAPAFALDRISAIVSVVFGTTTVFYFSFIFLSFRFFPVLILVCFCCTHVVLGCVPGSEPSMSNAPPSCDEAETCSDCAAKEGCVWCDSLDDDMRSGSCSQGNECTLTNANAVTDAAECDASSADSSVDTDATEPSSPSDVRGPDGTFDSAAAASLLSLAFAFTVSIISSIF